MNSEIVIKSPYKFKGSTASADISSRVSDECRAGSPFDAELEAVALATAVETAVWMSCALAAEVAAASSAP